MKYKLLAAVVNFTLILSGCNQSSSLSPISTPIPSISENAKPLSVAEAVAKVKPSIVRISTNESSGSGIVIDNGSKILTNNHVVEKVSSGTITFDDGHQVTGQVVNRDLAADLAVLKLDSGNSSSAIFGNSDEVQLGEEVLVLGFPVGLNTSITVTKGIISAFPYPYLQTDAAANPGNSGGPLINM